MLESRNAFSVEIFMTSRMPSSFTGTASAPRSAHPGHKKLVYIFLQIDRSYVIILNSPDQIRHGNIIWYGYARIIRIFNDLSSKKVDFRGCLICHVITH